MPKKNPHCPVDRCKTTKPHAQDPLVALMMGHLSTPQVYLHWVKLALLEVRDSIVDDHCKGRYLCYWSRIRLVEELYFRTLYLLFVAAPDEVPHVFSGDFPNSFAYMYDRVNEEILLGRGNLNAAVVSFDPAVPPETPLKWLNAGAHASYPLLLVLNFDPNEKSPSDIDSYLEKYLDLYLDHIQEIGYLFVQGAALQTVRDKIIELHRPGATGG